jgi:hypothetical protein
MKKSTKKTSTARKLMPAFAMLAVSAMSLSSVTYAWFSMNTQVTATGMQVQAKAEGGIVISNESKTDWNASATASHNSVAFLNPTSTENLTDWYHNTSTDANSANAHATSGYVKVSSDANWKNKDGIQFIDTDNDDTIDSEESCYYLLNRFYIQSSAGVMTEKNLYINSVTATGAGTSADLDASLRVAVQIGSGAINIYAPVTGATTSYWVNNGATQFSATSSSANNGLVNTQLGTANSWTIPAYAADGSGALEAKVYIYFEGEDAQCKSSNIRSTLDTLQVSVTFGTTTITNS